MKIITQEEFDNIPIVDGYKLCPTGDYTLIKEFPAWSIINSGSIIGASSIIGEGVYIHKNCTIDNHVILHSFVRSMSGLEIPTRTLYVWMTKDGVFCQAGYFFGKEEIFIKAVKEEYGNDSVYLKALEVLKMQPNDYE